VTKAARKTKRAQGGGSIKQRACLSSRGSGTALPPRQAAAESSPWLLRCVGALTCRRAALGLLGKFERYPFGRCLPLASARYARQGYGVAHWRKLGHAIGGEQPPRAANALSATSMLRGALAASLGCIYKIVPRQGVESLARKLALEPAYALRRRQSLRPTIL